MSHKRAKNKKKPDKHVWLVSYVYVVANCLLLPLFIDNRYFNIIEAKANCFLIGSAIIFAFACIDLISHRYGNISRKFSNIEMLLVSFCIVGLLASVFSESFTGALFGLYGWRIGLLPVCLLTAQMIFFSRAGVDRGFLFRVILWTNLFIFLLGSIDGTGADLLGLHQHMLENQRYQYLSTIGNANSMAGYLCIILPFLVLSYLNGCRNEVLAVITVILGFENIILCNSDSLFLGAAVGGLIAVPLIINTEGWLRKALLLGGIFGIQSLLTVHLPFFSEAVNRFDGITGLITNEMISVPMIVVCWAGFILLRHHTIEKKTRCLLGTVSVILISTVLLGALAVLIRDYTLNPYNFGSGRGAIWNESVRIFIKEYSLRQKIIGVGPDMLGTWYQNLSIGFGQHVLVSHSEPLQVLMTFGVVGMAVYIIGCGIVFTELMKKRNDPQYMIYGVSVLAYFGQSLLNSAGTVNIAILVVMLSTMYHLKRCEQ